MIQIKSFTPLDPNVAMDVQRQRIWEQAKTKGDLLARRILSRNNLDATGLIDFHMEGTDQVLTFPLHLNDEGFVFTTLISACHNLVSPVTGQMVRINATPMVSIGFVI